MGTQAGGIRGRGKSMQELRRLHAPSLAPPYVASATQSSKSLAMLAGEDVQPAGDDVLEPPLGAPAARVWGAPAKLS